MAIWQRVWHATVWVDSAVGLYWVINPGKSWKTFVANRARKIAEITTEAKIEWRCCPTKENVADLGSRRALSIGWREAVG